MPMIPDLINGVHVEFHSSVNNDAHQALIDGLFFLHTPRYSIKLPIELYIH
jgi:hypothetical protein